ncbi:MAG: hypothetical protein AAF967_12785, partial [Pseudomonadota bacterium]
MLKAQRPLGVGFAFPVSVGILVALTTSCCRANVGAGHMREKTDEFGKTFLYRDRYQCRSPVGRYTR